MKTAVSIPDKVYNSAEKLAKQLGKTRSEFYAQAVSSYIAKHKTDDVTTKLNEIYSFEDSSLDSKIKALQSATISKEEW